MVRMSPIAIKFIIINLFLALDFSVLEVLKLKMKMKGSLTWDEWIWWWYRISKGKTQMARGRRRGLAAIISEIWKERNAREFRKDTRKVEEIVANIKFWIFDSVVM
ncbi:hypothetical protein AKJ16_DCAP16258 [Drosera capensis]